MSEELKPCPFCGGEGKHTLSKCNPVNYVGCHDDYCPANDAFSYNFADEEGKQDALKAWNTRADDQFKQALIEARDVLKSIKYDYPLGSRDRFNISDQITKINKVLGE